MQSDHYVPERMLNKIDKMTNSMMENGMNQFYLSFTTFQRKLFGRAFVKPDEDDSQALSMSQLKRPMIVLLGLLGVAVIVFVAEKVMSKWRNRRYNEG